MKERVLKDRWVGAHQGPQPASRRQMPSPHPPVRHTSLVNIQHFRFRASEIMIHSLSVIGTKQSLDLQEGAEGIMVPSEQYQIYTFPKPNLQTLDKIQTSRRERKA